MTSTHDWPGRTGNAWAAEWRRTDRSFAGLSPYLDDAIRAAAPAGPFRALDIGCGAGGTSLALAAARRDADITGVDLSQALVGIAAERGRVSPNCRFVAGDVAEAAAAIRPDLLFSRHGVMFFPDPVAAFHALRDAATPGAALVFSCFAERSANRFATLADELVPPLPADSLAPGPFAFADPDHVRGILQRAGWMPDATARIEFAYRIGEGDAPVTDAVGFLSRIGPLATALAEAPDRDGLRLALADRLAHYQVGDVIELPATAWIWRAKAGEQP